MKYKFTLITALMFSNLFFTQTTLAADPGKQIEHILSLKEAPAGIVFEIVTGTTNSLKWALPQTQDYIKKIRAHFPNVDRSTR